MSALARLAIEDRAGLIVVTLSGELDASNAREILDQLGAAMPSDAHDLVLDLSVATYLDSSGVRVLFELARRLRRSQQQLTLVAAPRARVRRVLDTVAVTTIAPLHDALPSALAAVATAPPTAHP